jgi:putative DNA primase/helicase
VKAASVPKELTDALDKLEDVAQEGDQYRAVCPVHHGHSLLVRWNSSSNALLVKCHDGCEQDDVITALRKMGVHIGSARQRYEYRDANGVLKWTKVRSRAKDGRRFTYFMCHSRKGVVPIEGVHLGKKNKKDDGTCRLCGSSEHPRGMLYNAEATTAAIRNGDEIWLVEGEKDADALAAKGVIATTAMNGVDDWGPIYVDQLIGARAIVIVADNDPHNGGKRGAYSRYLSLTDHVETVCVKIAKVGKDSFDHLHAGYGLKDFVEVTEEELKELTQLSNGDPVDATDPLPGEPWTNLGYMKRFIELHGSEVICVDDDYRLWDGTHWRLDERRKVLRMASTLSRRMLRVAEQITDEKNGTPFVSHALRHEGSGNIKATLELAKGELTFPAGDLDSDSHMLVCRDGIYVNGKWAPHDPLRLYTKLIDMAHDPKATCPQWDRFLRTSIPDSEQRRYLQTLLGFAMVGGDRKKKRIVNLIGPRDTGKSTFLRILGDILGPYLVTPAVDELVSTGGKNSDKFALSELRGARIAAVSETDAGSKFRVAPLKAITGGDVISTQSKHKNPIQWRASVMLLIATNEHIIFDASDSAFLTRLVPIEFKRSRRIDRALDDKLEAEKPGIFNWLLEGVASFLRDELIEPDSIETAREAAAEAVSTPMQFLREKLDDGKLREVTAHVPPAKCIRTKELRTGYEIWCETNKIKPMAPRTFERTIATRYPKTEGQASDGYRHFIGLAVNKRPRKTTS